MCNVATDNPSYFAVASGSLSCPTKGKFSLFKKKMGMNSPQEAITEPSTSSLPSTFRSNGLNTRIPLRTLLRSVSSNSAESNQELLVLGEPRPSDIAPHSPCLTSHRDESRRGSTKSKKSKNDISNDLVYSPLATSEDAVIEIDCSDVEDEEEVFLMEDSARYYNLTNGKDTSRRHSIGTYLTHERERAMSTASSSKSYRDDLLQVHATIDGEVVKPSSSFSSDVGEPKSFNSDADFVKPSTSYVENDLYKSASVQNSDGEGLCARHSRRKCPRCSVKGGSSSFFYTAGMDDILIVSSRSSQAAALWVNYFGTCFDQISRQKNRPALKVFHLGIEDLPTTPSFPSDLEHRITSVKLHIIIICPHLLEYVASSPQSTATLCSLLKPDRTIAMLLGVVDDDLSEVHHTAMGSYRQWRRHQVGQDQDQDFAREFLQAAMGILTKVAKEQQAAAMEERTTFSVMPKKVKQSQNRLVVLLAEPLNKEDIIRISVDKNGDLMEVKPIKRRNPYTLKFTMPDRCLEVSSIVNVLVEKNGNMLGARPVKCESRLRELDQVLRAVNDPVEFMCQTLGFSPSSSEQLDSWMVHAFQKNLPPHFNLLTGPAPSRASNDPNNPSKSGNPLRHPHGHEEYPTLLHFAARYGLERLAWQMLECPGAEAACEIRNGGDFTAAEIAERAGHHKVASALRGYMQMNEFTNMYSQLKELSQTKQNTAPPDVDEDEYLLPRSADMTYSVPPPARPYSPVNHGNANTPIAGYLEMQPSTNNLLSTNQKYSNPGRTTPVPKMEDHNGPGSKSGSMVAINEPHETDSGSGNEHRGNREAYQDKVQGELLEIINDFKNNVFTLSEVEKLVDDWRNRNDVQKSFKEKEEQLSAMRREYERIQQRMKEEMKRPTPFDRIKKLFSRGSRQKDAPSTITITRDLKFETGSIGSEDKTSDNNGPGGQNQLRPISSLSLQSTASSSSSGRMSTISGCSATSLGDSGTHSDHEDRKLMRQTSSDHEYLEINDSKKNQNFNYLIPPTPKPVFNKYTPLKSATGQQFSTITERPPHPTPRVETPSQDDQYYIEFPPSGLPINAQLLNDSKVKSQSASPMPREAEIQSYLSLQEPVAEYVNFPAAESKNEDAETEQLPEYMNFQLSPPPALPPRK